jgi:hypothetical protein
LMIIPSFRENIPVACILSLVFIIVIIYLYIFIIKNNNIYNE